MTIRHIFNCSAEVEPPEQHNTTELIDIYGSHSPSRDGFAILKFARTPKIDEFEIGIRGIVRQQ